MSELALHGLPLEQERPNGEQLVVAAHALVVPLFPGNVDSHSRRSRDVRLDDRAEVLQDNTEAGAAGRHMRFVFALKQIVDGR